MAQYLVVFSLGANNEYLYPKGIAGVVWRSACYHHSQPQMVGETDAEVETDGKRVIALTPDDFKKFVHQFEESYPQKNLPDLLQTPKVGG